MLAPAHRALARAIRDARRPFVRTFAAAEKPAIASAINEIKSPRELDEIVPASHTTAIVFDFYADWCGPCKQLTPTLERIIKERYPKVALVKLNADAPALAPVMEQLRISSLPTVMGLSRGRFVDEFKGAIGESDVVKFVDGLIRDLELGGGATREEEGVGEEDGDAAATREDAVAATFAATFAADATTRERIAKTLSEVINAKENVGPELKCRALAASAMLAIRGDAPDAEGARRLVDAGRGLVKGFAEPRELACAEAWIGLVSDIKTFGVSTDVGALEAAHEAEPKNFDAVRALALARFASGDQSGAFDVALLAVKAGFGANEIREEGKKLVVQLISACAPGDPLAEATRKRLASAWFI